jgi:hypothetical protein
MKLEVAAVTAYPATMAIWFNQINVTDLCCLMGIVESSSNDANYHTMYARGDVAGDPVEGHSEAQAASTLVAATTSGFTANVWHRAAYVLTSATSRTIYLNAGSSGANTTSGTPSGLNRTTIGAQLDSVPAGHYFNGNLAHACVWNRALSVAELWQDWAPETRWDFYYPLRRRMFSFPSEEVAAATPKRLLLLGVG